MHACFIARATEGRVRGSGSRYIKIFVGCKVIGPRIGRAPLGGGSEPIFVAPRIRATHLRYRFRSAALHHLHLRSGFEEKNSYCNSDCRGSRAG